MQKQSLKKIKTINPQELRLKELKKKKKALLKKLQTQQIKLDTLKEEIKAFTRTHPNAFMYEMFEQSKKVTQEVCNLLKEILKNKKLKPKQREAVKESLEGIEEGLKAQEEDFLAQSEKAIPEFNEEEFLRLREEGRFRSPDEILKSLTPEVPTEEQKNIRELYLQLVKECHPDKHVGKDDQEKYHDLMQEINLAYHQKDFNRLLQLKNIILSSAQIDPSETLAEKQKREIGLLEYETGLLESNLSRLKEEINNIKKSELGYAHKMIDKMKSAMQTDFEQGLEEMQFIKMELENFLETGIFPENLFKKQETIYIDEDELMFMLNDFLMQQMKNKK